MDRFAGIVRGFLEQLLIIVVGFLVLVLLLQLAAEREPETNALFRRRD